MKRVPIAEVCLINPRISPSMASAKDRDVDFIAMANLGEDGRITPNGTKKLGEVLKGYTFFQNGDVIVAKITPCMENGKAAYVHNLPNGIAFGSTEFHVIRANVLVNPRFLFHMVWTPFFRREAVRNMTGTAGQQRVPTSFLSDLRFPCRRCRSRSELPTSSTRLTRSGENAGRPISSQITCLRRFSPTFLDARVVVFSRSHWASTSNS